MRRARRGVLVSLGLGLSILGCGDDDGGGAPATATDGGQSTEGGNASDSAAGDATGGGSDDTADGTATEGTGGIAEGETVVTVTLQSQSDAIQTDAPVTFAHVFSPGAIVAGSSLAGRLVDGTPVPLQVDIKATHGDGSLRHAVMTAVVPTLGAGASEVLELAVTREPLFGGGVSLDSLLAGGFEAAVTIDVAGVSWTASVAEFAETPQPWRAGPLASEWHLAASLVNAAGDVHPHLQARFYVRAYSDALAHVDVVVENAWSYEAGPQNYTYAAVVELAGEATQIPEFTHLRQARWRRGYWWGAAPQVHVIHDAQYLINTGALPSYDPDLVIAEQALADLAQRWQDADTAPMGTGLVDPAMPGTGARADIGPLPRWDVLYLLSMDADAKAAMLGTASLAGSWPVHYRDKNTGLPTSLEDYPYMTLLGNPGDAVNPETGQSELFPDCGGDCSSGFDPDTAHQPSLGYLAYLVDGDYYALEELQYWTNWNMLRSNPYYRDFENGLLHPNQIRAQGWSLRTLGFAAYITPDEDPLKAYFATRMDTNIAWYNDNFVNGDYNNPLGINSTNFAYDDGRGIAPWQDDFFSWSVGQLLALGFEAVAPLAAYKGQFTVGRLGPSFCWVVAAAYSLNVRDSEGAPLYADMAQTFAANFPELVGVQCGGADMAQLLGLQTGEMVGYASSTTGYPSNLQPALAAAVDAGVEGAAAAWALFEARAVQPDYADYPNFAVIPRP